MGTVPCSVAAEVGSDEVEQRASILRERLRRRARVWQPSAIRQERVVVADICVEPLGDAQTAVGADGVDPRVRVTVGARERGACCVRPEKAAHSQRVAPRASTEEEGRLL